MRLFRASPCTCYNSATNDYDETCDLCEFGQVYTEETLDDEVRVLVTEVKRRYVHPDFGFVQVGDMKAQSMPDEILLGNLDKLVLTERYLQQRETVLRGDDELSQLYPYDLRSVRDADTSYTAGVDCELDAAAGAITWNVAGPTAGDNYTVEYFYHPSFWCLLSDETPPRPVPLNTTMTPQKTYLVEKHPGTG